MRDFPRCRAGEPVFTGRDGWSDQSDSGTPEELLAGALSSGEGSRVRSEFPFQLRLRHGLCDCGHVSSPPAKSAVRFHLGER